MSSIAIEEAEKVAIEFLEEHDFYDVVITELRPLMIGKGFAVRGECTDENGISHIWEMIIEDKTISHYSIN